MSQPCNTEHYDVLELFIEVHCKASAFHSAHRVQQHGDQSGFMIMATAEERTQCEGDFKMESLVAKAPCVSDQMKMVDSPEISINSLLSSVSPMCDQTAAGDSDLRSVIEETAFQALTDGPLVKRPRFTFCDDGFVEVNDFLSLTFPKKLWKIVESEQFKSIWWDDEGNYVVIDEELFKREVLERRGLFRIFETDCMKSFIRQLNLYGFSKIRQDFQRSASLAEFLAEEKTVTALNKLQFYHNPNFRRDYPHLLGRMKRRVGIKNAVPVTCSLEQDFGKSSPKNIDNPDTQKSVLGIDSSPQPCDHFSSPSEDATQNSLSENPTTSQKPPTATNRIRSGYAAQPSTSVKAPEHGTADPSAKLSQLAPFHQPQHTCHNRVNTHDIDSTTTTSATSLYHVIPPVPSSPFGHMMGFPSFQTMFPDISVMQAHLASLLPFCNPWFSMPMIAAASAISMSRSSHHRTPSYHHCPNCNCSVNNANSTKGGPKSNEYMGYHR
ncbi:heat shock transcription factor, Y-linked-like isoform X1 [Rhinatrema bivittatum]|uniref:heat shock transcription factor, Y-linked-like isoform X1 n=1 Tax=Rhinatrema bivittatum TaxID=194408 RepID=UPI00112CBF5A|nr:heat shock transcription factor, Y-linked-like isoform X1 [Rhinatrema bivittatum]